MKRTIITSLLLGVLPLMGMAQGKSSEAVYAGPKVNLSENTLIATHIAKLQGVSGEGYQGMDIWGDYVVSLQNTGWATIYETDGKKLTKLVEPFKLASYNKNNHCNVACFSRLFYDKDDKFPLMYVSQCQHGTINGRKDVIYVERIHNDLKSSELIQTIYFKDTSHLFGYALQWVIDVDNNFLYGYGNTVDNSNPLNRHRIVKFRLPSLDEATDGLVVLTNDDLLENYLLEDTYAAPFNPIGQGLFVKNGMLIMPTGVGEEKRPSILYVWNLAERTMQNVIDLSKVTFGELEDCAYYKGDLMIQAQGDYFKVSFK